MLNSATDTICNSFIITTEDGKLIVINGGYESENENFIRLFLRKSVCGLRLRGSGQTVTAEARIKHSPHAAR